MGSMSGTGIMASNARAPNAPSSSSHVYRPTYTNYSSPTYRAVRGASTEASNILSGLGGTPQARTFTAQMPTYTRPSAPTMPVRPTGGFFGRGPQTGYSIPMVGSPRPAVGGVNSSVDPNLAIINRAFAPGPEYVLDSDGNRHPPPPQYMEQSQRDAIMKNPGAYLEYAKYIQGGGDPAQFQRSAQPVRMMTVAQQQNLAKSQAAELGKILPAAAPVDSGGGG